MKKTVTFILAIIVNFQMSCKHSALQLTLSCEKSSEFRSTDTVEFTAKLSNTSNRTLFIYGFCNPIREIYSLNQPDWKLMSCDEIGSTLGLNVVIIDSAGALKINQDEIEVFDLSGADTIPDREISPAELDSFLLSEPPKIPESSKHIQLTKTKIDPGQVLRAQIFLDLSEYGLGPGVYSLTLIYDAARSSIGFVEPDKDNFIGCVSSNSIKIKVK